MSDDYGERVSLAIAAVRQLHSDSSRLLADCDKEIGRGVGSFFSGTATSNLTYHVDTDSWMAEGVFRYYKDPDDASRFRAITICFFDRADGILVNRIKEPLLLIGELTYKTGVGAAQHWDLWNAYFNADTTYEMGCVYEMAGPDASAIDPRLERVRLVAVPLYSIASIDSVKQWMDRVSPRTPPA